MSLAPILLFTYKRLGTLQQTVSSLQKNQLSSQSDLFVFSDAAKSEKDIDSVGEVRSYLKTITDFKTITIHESPTNKGLATSIISGVTQIINDYGKIIVLEDDLETSPNFLSFMNQALDYYEHHASVFSISGFTMPMKGLRPDEVYFTQRASSWGWATWKDRWTPIDWQVKDYASFRCNDTQRKLFNRMGSDMSDMLDRQMRGDINSWAIRWCYHQYKKGLYTVFPAESKVQNIGLENPASTHTNERFNRFKTKIDQRHIRQFRFSDTIELDKYLLNQFTRPYSIPERVKYKLLNLLFAR
ncbi:glycosyltransferase family protein [Spirosoma fluviale]|uniref:GNT-I family protein n=1 Tax=Spirosoma fluviale TaxID=1597977 RepID=A0A286GS38_9BACT|nr:sugar transferase [Spirosoma fluviale]SOD98302.1 GNT-I family protein [Spirosoma fluviale]